MKKGSCSKVLPILSNKAEEKIHWALSELNTKNNEKTHLSWGFRSTRQLGGISASTDALTLQGSN